MAFPRICKVDGCDKPAKARGCCPTHYYRFRRHGDALGGRPPNGSSRCCQVAGCDRSAHSRDHGCRGYCEIHYIRVRKYGHPLGRKPRQAKPPRYCAVDGCGKRYHSFGFCSSHTAKFKRHGDPLAGRRGAPRGAPLRWIRDNANYKGDDCLAWPFETTRWGYGTVKHEGKRRSASRVMCILAHGEPPAPEHEALHSCGNGHISCMNRNHLRWGSKVENVHEAMVHGTNIRGEKCNFSKLTEKDVLEIRQIGTAMLQREIAKIYGVRAPTIGRILSGERWGWLTSAPRKPVTDNLSGRQWRKRILRRDGFTCQRCGSRRPKLDAHHMEAYCENSADRNNLDNGITLCVTCHRGFHSKYGERDFGHAQLNEYLAEHDGGKLQRAG